MSLKNEFKDNNKIIEEMNKIIDEKKWTFGLNIFVISGRVYVRVDSTPKKEKIYRNSSWNFNYEKLSVSVINYGV